MGTRVLGVDVGRRRIGLAISDPSRTLARPLATLSVSGGNALHLLVAEVERLAAEEDGLSAIVIGVPVRLDGTPGTETEHAAGLAAALRRATTVPVIEAEERLTSREAESRLAVRERDWRKRKARLDAAAAAVILQDYLDLGRGRPDPDRAPDVDAGSGRAARRSER